MSVLTELFPERDADTSALDVGSGHSLYIEQSGNESGIPVLYLHGGPGSGAKEDNRRLFNPEVYRLIIHDQRGSGRSRPHGHLHNNDTANLLNDIELIRRHYGISNWVVYGGSWGAALALAYAEAYPERVLALVLRSVFLARSCDIEWHNGMRGASLIFPDAWQELCAAVPSGHRNDPVAWLAIKVLSDAPEQQRLAAAMAWNNWAGRVVTWMLPAAAAAPPDAAQRDAILRRVGIEMHYGVNNYFLQENQLLQHAHLLPKVPVHILHGRCDMTCTLAAAWELHRRLPQSQLQILPYAGHLSSEPQMQQALLRTLATLSREL